MGIGKPVSSRRMLNGSRGTLEQDERAERFEEALYESINPRFQTCPFIQSL
jgi:hypothetical protein